MTLHFHDLLQHVLLELMGIIVPDRVQTNIMEGNVVSNVIVGLMKRVTLLTAVLVVHMIITILVVLVFFLIIYNKDNTALNLKVIKYNLWYHCSLKTKVDRMIIFFLNIKHQFNTYNITLLFLLVRTSAKTCCYIKNTSCFYELWAENSYSLFWLLFVWCLSVRLSVNFLHFHFLPRINRPILTKLFKNHP